MEKHQFLLLKLMEECAEVSQRASKQIQFGALEVQNTASGKSKKDNAERLHDEIADLLVLVRLLIEDREIAPFSKEVMDQRYIEKKAKLQKYLDYSYQLGELPEIRL